jgi:twitching motility protein PilT
MSVTTPAAPETARGINLRSLLEEMIERNASDLHITAGERPKLRVDGFITDSSTDYILTPKDTLQLTYSILTENQKKRFETEDELDFSFGIQNLARFRGNVYRQRGCVALAIRQIPFKIQTFEELRLPSIIQKLAERPRGLVLVTGPTGSGKSTTLCALIDLVNRERTDHIITIEDPIEFVHKNKKCVITQRQVGVHTKSFKSALRAALREDPDIILVGEMRDLETISIAIETAETGHLVFGTLHTTTAAGTVDRIIDQFPADRQEQIRVMLAESLKGVVSQTLCRKIGGGRVAAREILLSTPSITNLIREAKTFQIQSVLQTSKKLGMVTLNDALIAYVDSGEVEPKEAFMKCVDKAGMVMMLKARGLDVSFAESDQAHGGAASGPPAGASTPGGAKGAPAPAKR